MTNIVKNRDIVTLINIFTVDPENQQRMVDLLVRVTETSVRYARGFVSSSLHRSVDGRKVVMYAQWRTMADYEAMRRAPTPSPILSEAMTFATFEPGVYEVVETFTPVRADA
jgi:quinol monooxygenase YgiN